MDQPTSHPDLPTPHPAAYPASDGDGGRCRRPRWLVVSLALVGAALTCGALVGVGLTLLWAVNPVGDEWHCSEGKAPATNRAGGSACFAEGATLPAGYRWHPLGNRPMPGNCDKDGWLPVERTVTRRGEEEIVEDCAREGTDLPPGWTPVDGGQSP